MNLQQGDKVICVDATGYLVDGQQYTVKRVFHLDNKIIGVTVNECIQKEGFSCYRTNRFIPIEKPYTVSITSDDLESLLDAFVALDYYSEGTYINIANYSKVVDKIEGQIKKNNN